MKARKIGMFCDCRSVWDNADKSILLSHEDDMMNAEVTTGVLLSAMKREE